MSQSNISPTSSNIMSQNIHFSFFAVFHSLPGVADLIQAGHKNSSVQHQGVMDQVMPRETILHTGQFIPKHLGFKIFYISCL